MGNIAGPGEYPMFQFLVLVSVKNPCFLELALDHTLGENVTWVSQNKLYFSESLMDQFPLALCATAFTTLPLGKYIR